MTTPAIIVEGIFRRIHQSLPYVARVTVHVEFDTPHTEVRVDCHGSGWGGSQGDVDDVSATGYDDWKAAAVHGVRYALKLAQPPVCRVTITRILGYDGTDTNPTIVGAAAADAMWKAVAYQPSDETRLHIESIVFRSWQTPAALPEFGLDQEVPQNEGSCWRSRPGSAGLNAAEHKAGGTIPCSSQPIRLQSPP